ncbi:ATP-dependent Clp protease ATP-binding subunit, partial [Enterococcus faecalis]|nr:ATP-dependent Clp protease ATP-binding subunit [Enterococcus faecalis]
MLCHNCKMNDATIHLYSNFNGRQQQVDLCQNCYQIMKTDPENPILGGLSKIQNQQRSPFDDFFDNLNNFQQSQQGSANQVPPTQAGQIGGHNGNRGGNQQPPKKGLLDEFGINVTEIARRGGIDPVIGR